MFVEASKAVGCGFRYVYWRRGALVTPRVANAFRGTTVYDLVLKDHEIFPQVVAGTSRVLVSRPEARVSGARKCGKGSLSSPFVVQIGVESQRGRVMQRNARFSRKKDLPRLILRCGNKRPVVYVFERQVENVREDPQGRCLSMTRRHCGLLLLLLRSDQTVIRHVKCAAPPFAYPRMRGISIM